MPFDNIIPFELYVFFLFWIGCIGSVVGSFLNVLAYRIPRGMNIAFPASHCPKCGAKIRPWHNIPVLGWMILRGKCKDCHEPISPMYPIIEALTGFFWLIASMLVFPMANENFTHWALYSIGAGTALSVVWGALLVWLNRVNKK